jgi:hypothetical protein
MWWYGNAASDTVQFDASANLWKYDDVDLVLGDSDILEFGDAAGGDVYVRWDGTDLDWLAATAGSDINYGADGDGFDVKWFSDTASSYMLWDYDDDRLEFDGADVNLQDDDILQFGDAQDLAMAWDGTDFDITALADDSIIKFGQAATAFDIWWYGNAETNTVKADAGANTLTLDDVDLYLGDNDIAAFGDGQDVQIRWDASDLDVLAAADDSVIKFGNGTNSFDIWWYGNTADTYVEFDASANIVEFQDSTILALGDDSDVQIRWDATDIDVHGLADDQVWKWGQVATAWDMWWYGNVSGDDVIFNGSDNTWSFDGVDVHLEDSDFIKFGDAQDVTMDWDGTNLDVIALADDQVWRWGQATTVFDMWWYGSGADDNVIFDGSGNLWQFDGVDIRMEDDDKIGFGDASQIQIEYDEDGDDDFVITDGTNELLAVADGGTTGNLTVTGTSTLTGAVTASSDVTAAGWIRPHVGTTAPDNLVKGALAVDSNEQDCFDAGDGTDGGSLCIYDGSAWQIMGTW